MAPSQTHDRSLRHRARWSPPLAAAAMAALTLLLWWAADTREQQRTRVLVNGEADAVAGRMAGHLELLAEGVERTSLRWSRLDALTADAASVESLLLLRDPSVSSVLWLDPDRRLEWAYGPDASPVPGQIDEWLRITPDPGWSLALDRDRSMVSRALLGPGGVRSFLIIVPLTLRSGEGGLMVAVIDLEAWLESVTSELGTQMEIAVRTREMGALGEGPPAGSLRQAVAREVNHDQLSLRVLVWPAPATLAALRSPLPRVVLVGGLVFALLLGVAIRLGHVEGQRDQDARMTAALAREVEARRRAEAELADRARALERSNDDLLQFARVISHDLREPLNVIDMHLQLLRESPSPDKTAQHVAKARRAGGRMVEMIEGLLLYSRVGGREGHHEVNTADCVRQAVANLESAIAEAGARVEYEDLPVVVGPAGQLTQLFQNVVGNAIRHRGELPPHIRVRAERQSRHWLFRVEDNGPGIPAELAERIFELFEGGGRSKGSGVGLATCRRLVESAGGRIWVQSRPGEGATFCFTWPAEVSPESPRGAAAN